MCVWMFFFVVFLGSLWNFFDNVFLNVLNIGLMVILLYCMFRWVVMLWVFIYEIFVV